MGGYMEGWICPRCSKVWAPWVRECECNKTGTLPYGITWPEYTQPSTGDPLPPPTVTICGESLPVREG